MLDKITLKRRFHSQLEEVYSSMRLCSPGGFSSSSFLQLRSKISNLGLHINTRMKRVQKSVQSELRAETIGLKIDGSRFESLILFNKIS